MKSKWVKTTLSLIAAAAVITLLLIGGTGNVYVA